MATKVTREDIDIIINFLKNNKEPVEMMDIYKNTNLKIRVIKAALNIIKEEYTIVISRSKSFGNAYAYSLKEKSSVKLNQFKKVTTEKRKAAILFEQNRFYQISIRHYRTGRQYLLCNDKDTYHAFMLNNLLISIDEEYFYDMKGRITIIIYVQ